MAKKPPYEPYRSAEGLPPAAAALLAYIRAHDYVTFAEMPKVLKPFMETRGEMAAEAPQVPNLLFWAGMSEAWVETLQALFTAHLIWQEPCSLTSYLIGDILRYLKVSGFPQPEAQISSPRGGMLWVADHFTAGVPIRYTHSTPPAAVACTAAD